MGEYWDMKIDINRKNDHYEGYINGRFVCSGDTVTEVATDLEKEIEKIRSEVSA